jgi:hypothetical protein
VRRGAVKLNKILFYADFGAYRKLGRSISGQTYQKLLHGPAPRALVPVVSALVEEGACAWAERNYMGFRQKKLLALREPDLAPFSAAEIDLLHHVIDELWELNGSEVSDLSHRFIGWQAASIGEDISYATVFVGEPTPLTEDEEAWALEVIREDQRGDPPPNDR